MLEKQGKFREAAFEYEKARANDPSMSNAICPRLAVLYDHLGEFEKAGSVEYETGMAFHPERRGPGQRRGL